MDDPGASLEEPREFFVVVRLPLEEKFEKGDDVAQFVTFEPSVAGAGVAGVAPKVLALAETCGRQILLLRHCHCLLSFKRSSCLDFFDNFVHTRS